MIDKNQAIIDFLIQCPQIRNNPLFFNFINAKDSNNQLITMANEVLLHRPYIDGSVLKRYTFTLIHFKSIAYSAIVKAPGYNDENVEDMLDVQGIIDWILEQAENRNYPNFGTDCQIDNMYATTDNPNLNGVDTNVTPALAKYSIAIVIEYLDMAKKLWNK